MGTFTASPARKLVGFILFCVFLMVHGLPWLVPSLGTWFYPLVWWSFIGLVEWGNLCRDNEVFWGRPGRVIRIAAISTVLWFVFEIYNLYLGNWYYVGVPELRGLRWAGTVISFATVLPGLWVVQRFIRSMLPGFLSDRSAPSFPRETNSIVLFAGLICSVGPLVRPELLFPLVWGGLLLVADGVAYRCGWRSFLRQWEEGNLKPLVSWLMSGMVCGFLWEFWNAQASAGWIYTVPWMGEWRLFEMPLLGYFGFPPFALMVRRLHTLYEDGPWSRGKLGPATLAIFGVCLSVMTLVGMDRYTFVSTRVTPMDFQGWTAEERKLYRDQPKQFWTSWEAYFPRESSARKIELLRFASMGTRTANCLWKNEIRSLPTLKTTPESELVNLLLDCRGVHRPFWERRVRDWKQRD